MGYSVIIIDFQKALSLVKEFPNALIYQYSNLLFGKTESLGEIDFSQCLECRFFSNEKELHILFDEKKAILVSDTEGTDDFIIRELPLKGRFLSEGKSVKEKMYLKRDEDGQAYVAITRLVAIM